MTRACSSRLSAPHRRTCAYTFLGVGLTLLCLSGLSTLVVDESDGRYFLMLGSSAPRVA